MAKKKSKMNVKLYAGVALVIVLVAPLVLLFMGIEVPVIGEFYSQAFGEVLPFPSDPFEIPFDQSNQQILDDRQIVLLYGFCLDGSVPSQIIGDSSTVECANGDMLMINCVDNNFCSDPFDPNAPFQEESVIPLDETNEMADEMNDGLMDIIRENMTEFSEDPPVVQICDQLGLACGTETVEVEAVITKIDFNGTRFVVTETFAIPQLAFFVEDTSNINFRDGFVELELFLKTEPSRLLEIIDADFDVTVGGQSIFQTPIKLEASGITTADGRLPIDFVSPTGIPSSRYTFDIEQNIGLFPQDSTTPIVMTLKKLDLTRNNVDLFAIDDQTIFSMDIVREAVRVIIQNEKTGELERVFPSDSKLIIHSKQFCVMGRICGTISTSTNPLIACPTVANSCVAFIDRPQIGRTELLLDGELFAFDNGGNTDFAVDIDVRRDENYTMTVFFPMVQTELEYGKSQQSKIFECFTEGTVTYNNRYYERTQWYTFSGHITTGGRLLEVASVNEGITKCNIP